MKEIEKKQENQKKNTKKIPFSLLHIKIFTYLKANKAAE